MKKSKRVWIHALAGLAGLALTAGPVWADDAAPKAEDKAGEAAPKDADKPAAPAGSQEAGWEKKEDAPATPGLAFTELKKNFGTVDEGPEVPMEFPFVNNSDKTITISQVKTSCGCTAAALDKKVFAPGEGDKIKVTFKTQGRGGHQGKTITVMTDDPANPTYQLSFEGDVFSRVFLTENVLNFGDIDSGLGKSMEFALVDLSETPIEIQSAESFAKGIEITVGTAAPHKDEKSGKDGRKTPITVKIPADYPAGNIGGTIALRTNYNGNQNYFVQMRGRIRGDIDAVPPTLFFGVVAPGESKDQTVSLETAGGKKFAMTGFEVEGADNLPKDANPKEQITVTVEDDPDGKGKQVLHAKIAAPQTRGAYRGDILVKGTIEGKETSLKVPFVASIRPEAMKNGIPAPGDMGDQSDKGAKNARVKKALEAAGLKPADAAPAAEKAEAAPKPELPTLEPEKLEDAPVVNEEPAKGAK
ncbi:DUF1573 domain-containing protein [Candidatus Poribacteria bacterium]|nr:DUF1573 domain-containing protein [Candidatus Poribacteria bacterium]